LKRHKAAQGVTVGEGDILFVSNGAGTANTYARGTGLHAAENYEAVFWINGISSAFSGFVSSCWRGRTRRVFGFRSA
jgi:hypothetical protein